MKESKNDARKRRKVRIRKKVNGTPERLRLCVFRSNKHIYAQLIEDISGSTLASASTKSLEGSPRLTTKSAFEVGKAIGALAKGKGIEKVVFDRNGYIYHGRIKSLADGAREAGLIF